MDGTGRPTMKAVGCSCNVGSADIKFHGGAAWIYNLFSGQLENKLKDMVGGGNGLVRLIFFLKLLHNREHVTKV